MDSLFGKTAETDVWGTKITLRSHYSCMIMTREQDMKKVQTVVTCKVEPPNICIYMYIVFNCYTDILCLGCIS